MVGNVRDLLDHGGSALSRFTWRPGPGLMVTAAFIGPGTVITASRAGASEGLGLLWTVILATTAAIVLQSLAARLGILSGAGLSEAIRDSLQGSPWRIPTLTLVIVAIGLGNAAYQTGNLTGAVVGLSGLAPGPSSAWVLLVSVAAATVILSRREAHWQNGLIALVVVLSAAFLVSAFRSFPAADRFSTAMLRPSLSGENISLVVAMLGTTIVPYNLFLHCSRSAKAWKDWPTERRLNQSRLDTIVSLSLGGLVTAAIVITASGAFHDTGTSLGSPGEIANQLRPTFGPVSGVAFSIGLFAAGMTSAVTAPLATAYAVAGCLGWSVRPDAIGFRAIALGVLVVGAAAATLLGRSPAATILAAQVANGLLLPIAASLMLVILWRTDARTDNQPGASSAGENRLPRRYGWLSLVVGWLLIAAIAALGLYRIAIAVFPSISG